MTDAAAVERHRKRADEMGDSMRRYLIGVNAGGIGVLATLADEVSRGATQIMFPLGAFTLGLLFTGISIWLQKVKAIRRQKAAEEDRPEPNFHAYFKSNETYDGFAFGLFIAGALGFFVIESILGVGQERVTLYRTSPAGEARIHVATFAASGEAAGYNKGNCEMVVRYMSEHAPAGYYWCEPGRFRP